MITLTTQPAKYVVLRFNNDTFGFLDFTTISFTCFFYDINGVLFAGGGSAVYDITDPVQLASWTLEFDAAMSNIVPCTTTITVNGTVLNIKSISNAIVPNNISSGAFVLTDSLGNTLPFSTNIYTI